MELITGKILGFILVMSRLGAFFAVAPVFSWKSIPRRILIGITVLIGILFASVLPTPQIDGQILLVKAILMIATEVIYGAALGYVCTLLFAVVRLSARIAEREMGLSMSNIINPLSGESAQALSIMMEMVFILLFLNANGHHILLVTVSKSYEGFPMGTMPEISVLLKSILESSAMMLMLGLKMSAPILASFLCMMVILAVMARVAPEANILFLSLPLRVGLGLLMVGIFLPFINNFVKEFADYLSKYIPL